MSIFDKFNETVDVEGLKEDIVNSTGDFKEVPHGTYEVSIEKIEPKESKSGNPMVAIWFKVLDGDYKGSLIFYNQVISSGFGIAQVCDMLKSFGTGVDIDFGDFVQFENLLGVVKGEVDKQGLEYALQYSVNEKNTKFSKYKIIQVFKPANTDEYNEVGFDDIPF